MGATHGERSYESTAPIFVPYGTKIGAGFSSSYPTCFTRPKNSGLMFCPFGHKRIVINVHIPQKEKK